MTVLESTELEKKKRGFHKTEGESFCGLKREKRRAAWAGEEDVIGNRLRKRKNRSCQVGGKAVTAALLLPLPLIIVLRPVEDLRGSFSINDSRTRCVVTSRYLPLRLSHLKAIMCFGVLT